MAIGREDFPAFPRTLLYENEHGAVNAMSYSAMAGMTLRDYFAAKAMAALIDTQKIKTNDDEYFRDTADAAYRIADAMLKVRKN